MKGGSSGLDDAVGIEDGAESRRLRACRNREETDAICRLAVRRLTDYTLDPVEFGRARRRLIEAASPLKEV